MTLRMRFRQSLARTLVLPVGVLLGVPLVAQAPSPQEKIAAFKESMAKNHAALRQYTWTETTDISLKGSDKKHEEKQCQYGADGKVQKTPIGGGDEKAPSGGGGDRRGGAVKKIVAKN